MLEKVDLTRAIPKDEYKTRLPALQASLYELQLRTSEAGLPSVIVFEGWEAAGKGTCINVLTSRLEPRAFRLHVIQEPRTHELHMPWLYRFWQRVPNYGQMAIFDRSWYRRVLEERVEKITPKSEWQKAYRDIADFERTSGRRWIRHREALLPHRQEGAEAAVQEAGEPSAHTLAEYSRRTGSATRNTASTWWPWRKCWSAPNPNGGRGPSWKPPTATGRASRSSRPSSGR
jgi:hypothetical protein